MTRKDCDNSMRNAALALVAALVAATSASGATFALWREAVIAGDDVRIGDVCRISDAGGDEASLAALPLVAAPAPGGALVLSADEVRRALRDGGVNPATIVIKGAATCAVRRPQPLVPAPAPTMPAGDTGPASAAHPRSLRQVIEAYFAAEAAGPDASVAVRFGRANEDALALSEPQFSFRIQRTSTQSLGMVALKVTVFERGDAVRELPLLVEVSRIVPVVVAAKPINLGAIVTASDLRIVEMAIARGDREGFTRSEEVIGQRARHFVAAGEPVLPRDLESVPLVKRGQLVDVQSNVGGVSIVTAAQALGDGAYGDVIGLRSDGNHRRQISAIVTGPGRVRIGGGDADLAMGGEQ